MGRVLVVFESKYGQSAKIAEHVADLARRRGHECQVVHLSSAGDVDIPAHEAVFVVVPVYFAKHSKDVARFLRAHADALTHIPCAFVAVSNSAGSREGTVRDAARDAAKAFVESTGVVPTAVVTAGGALAYPRYGFFTRLVMKSIARKKGEPLDTTRVHELTDWAALDASTSAFLALLEPRPSVDESGAFPMPGPGRARVSTA